MKISLSGRLDPELVAPLKFRLSRIPKELHDIPARRAIDDRLTGEAKKLLSPIEGVSISDRMVSGPVNAPDVFVRVYRPDNRLGMLPALLYIHGGGYVLSSVEAVDLRLRRLTLAVDCVIVAVEYRLAPENPFPAALDDCYAVLKWMCSNARELGIDNDRVAIGGASAGGGLAASLTLLVRDCPEENIVFQLLIYPMIDDKNVIQASRVCPDTLPWTRENNLIAWKAYLGADFGKKSVSPYAAAFRAANLAGVPPAYIAVGELDSFLEEDVIYAQRLIKAGVPTELHVYPGACHGFDSWAPNAKVSMRFIADQVEALKRALHG